MFSISSVTIYYGTQSDIRVKSYSRLNFLRASVFNFECLDILRNSIEHPNEKLLSFKFAQSFFFQCRASRYIAVSICYKLQLLILSVSIYYGTQSDIRIKIYCRLNLLRASVFNFVCLDILRDSIRHLNEKLLSVEFA